MLARFGWTRHPYLFCDATSAKQDAKLAADDPKHSLKSLQNAHCQIVQWPNNLHLGAFVREDCFPLRSKYAQVNFFLYYHMPRCTPIWEGVPPRPRDLGGGGYPYHHNGFGSGAGVPGSSLPTTTILNDFSIDSSSRTNDTKTRTKFRYIWDKCLEFSQS